MSLFLNLRATAWPFIGYLSLIALGSGRQAVGEELGRGQRAPSEIAADESSVSTAVEARLRADLGFLADDKLRGRGIGTDGIRLAAEHIAQSFADSGLRIDLFKGQPYQTFEIPVPATMGPVENNRLVFIPKPNVMSVDESQADANVVRAEITGELERTFRPMAIGDSAKVEGDLVFAGYGITAPEYGYDDYAKIDAKGRVVMILRKEPDVRVVGGKFEGPKNTQHAYFETKIKNAHDHGAVAVLMVNDPESIVAARTRVEARIAEETKRLNKIAEQMAQLPDDATNSRETLRQRRDTIKGMMDDLAKQRILADEGLMDLGEAGEKVMVSGMPVVSISRPMAGRLLRMANWDSIDAMQQRIDKTVSPASVVLNHRVSLETKLNSAFAKSSNVIGVLEGKGSLADQTVIVGAHYDHVGMGGIGSLAPGTIAVHNGADDNASGTAALMASAREVVSRLAQTPTHRRVVFIAFTGEEMGLLGSEYYVRHPRFPLESTVAMINLDMVGRLRDNDLTVYGTGSAVEMDEIVETANRSAGFKLFKVASGYGPSDHQSFYTQKIPVLFFFTGLHNDYHRPGDDFDKINFTGLTRITDITSGVAIDLATRPERPRYAATGRDVSIRWQASAHLGIQLRATAEGGVQVTSIVPGGAAALAGVMVGDRLRKLDDVEVRTVGEVLETIRTREAGDPLKVELQRGESILTLDAVLQKRPG